MLQLVKCPSCAAPLEIDGNAIERCNVCGSRLTFLSNNIVSSVSFEFDGLLSQAQKLKEILSLAQSGRKIEAIKIYRETFGSGLKEAKDAVDALERRESVTFTEFNTFTVNSPFSQTNTTTAQSSKIAEIQQELRFGHKINAVKIYRETFGGSLKDAKDAIDALERGELVNLHLNKPFAFNHQSIVKREKSKSWIVFVFMLLVIIAVIGIGIALFAIVNTAN